jgi:hypothetical protein
MRRRHGLDET